MPPAPPPLSRRAAVLVLPICLLGLLIGALITAAGIGVGRRHLVLQLRGTDAVARVEAKTTRESAGRGGGTQHLLTFSFRAGGREVRGEEIVPRTHYRAVSPGSPLEVVYDRDHPGNHALKGRVGQRLGMPLVSLLFGLATLAACGYALAHTVRALRQ